jgi:hypothetical protein
MLVQVFDGFDSYWNAQADFVQWLGHRPDYDRNLVIVMPV